MADLSYLFGTSTPASVGNTATTTSETYPDWLQEYTKSLMGKSTQVAGEDYQNYTGSRIADFTPDQQAAMDMTRQQTGQWQPGLQFAGQTAPQQIDQYMNPYTDSVVDRIAQLGQRNLTENLLPQVNSTFTGAGQFGSTRHADFTGRALRDANESILGQQSQALQTGYQNATTNFQNDATRLANTANLAQTLGYQDAGMLSAVGQQQQNLDQTSLDTAYQNFLEQRDYPKTQLQFLNETIRGLPTGSTRFTDSTQVTPTNTMSPLQQAAAAFSGTKSLLTGPTATNTTGLTATPKQ